MVNRLVSVNDTMALQPEVLARLKTDLDTTAKATVLGMCHHNPDTQAEYGVNTTLFASLAPAILKVTFVAPASGKVTVDLSAYVSSCADQGFWALVSAGAVIQSTKTRVSGPAALDKGFRCQATVLVEGLTAGQTYTFEWAAATSSGGMSLRMGGGPQGANSALAGAATMIVRDAPF